MQIQAVLSIAAILLSSISLGWQVWTYSRSGPRVTADLVDHRKVRSGIRVRNHGRTAITIESVQVETMPSHPETIVFENLLAPLRTRREALDLKGPKFPYRLEPLSSEVWRYTEPGVHIEASVRLATGELIVVDRLRPRRLKRRVQVKARQPAETATFYTAAGARDADGNGDGNAGFR